MKRLTAAVALIPLLSAAIGAGESSGRISEYQCYQMGRAWDAADGRCELAPLTKDVCQRQGGHWLRGGCNMQDAAGAQCAKEGGALKVDYHGNYACERAGSAGFRTESIYGQDDRQDLYQVSDPRVRSWAESTVALIPQIGLIPNPADGSFGLRQQVYGQALDLCRNERFWDQPMAADCSGFLAAPDLIVTGASCVRDVDQCRQYKFIFGFSVDQAGSYPSVFPAENVYDCKEIVASDLGYDHWAVIRLDRPVSGRRPLAVDRSGNVAMGSAVVSVGPDLIPLKVSHGRVTASDVPSSFRADLNGGNSGIPVFDSNTGLVEGIMTWFPPSFQWDQANQCYGEVLCPAATGGLCAGVSMTKMSVIAPALPQSTRAEQKTAVAPKPASNVAAATESAEASASALNRQ